MLEGGSCLKITCLVYVHKKVVELSVLQLSSPKKTIKINVVNKPIDVYNQFQG